MLHSVWPVLRLGHWAAASLWHKFCHMTRLSIGKVISLSTKVNRNVNQLKYRMMENTCTNCQKSVMTVNIVHSLWVVKGNAGLTKLIKFRMNSQSHVATRAKVLFREGAQPLVGPLTIFVVRCGAKRGNKGKGSWSWPTGGSRRLIWPWPTCDFKKTLAQKCGLLYLSWNPWNTDGAFKQKLGQSYTNAFRFPVAISSWTPVSIPGPTGSSASDPNDSTRQYHMLGLPSPHSSQQNDTSTHT